MKHTASIARGRFAWFAENGWAGPWDWAGPGGSHAGRGKEQGGERRPDVKLVKNITRSGGVLMPEPMGP